VTLGSRNEKDDWSEGEGTMAAEIPALIDAPMQNESIDSNKLLKPNFHEQLKPQSSEARNHVRAVLYG
jgi:hypothetical protein